MYTIGHTYFPKSVDNLVKLATGRGHKMVIESLVITV